MAWRVAGAKSLSEPMLIFVNWTHTNKLQWNLYQKSYYFIKENVFENVVRKIAAIFPDLNVLVKCTESGTNL